jgi:hypothetical protein
MLSLVDTWLAGLDADAFTVVLAPLRRTFAVFAGPERRLIGERVRAGLPRPIVGPPGGAATDPADAGGPPASPAPAILPTGAVPAGHGPAWDLDRIAAVLPALTALLGPTGTAPAGTRPDSTALAHAQEEYSDA